MAGQAPVFVLNANTKREQGRQVQLGNITAAKNVSEVVRTCLGPRAMLKMLLDPMGGIVMTNDGNAILREIEVPHPAAKSMIEISRAQDEEVGDGTTSVIILTGEMLSVAKPFIEKQNHPSVIIGAYSMALDDMLKHLEQNIAIKLDTNNNAEMQKIVKSCLGTKFAKKFMDLAVEIALKAVRTVTIDSDAGREIDIKRYAKVEKIPGGEIEESRVLQGVMFNKDVIHQKMKRRIEKPRIILLDCPLEYKKGESQTNVEISKEDDWNRYLQIEEEKIKEMALDILKFRPDLIITEKGISDYAAHIFAQHGVSAIRRLRKSDNLRVARACGASIVSRTDELKESDVGTGAGLFEVRLVGDEYFTFLEECTSPTACTILLRGASKDILMEVERNLQDAMCVARNVLLDPKLVPGGGATEIALSMYLNKKAKEIEGVKQWPYRAVADALEAIPRILIQNCGGSPIRMITALRAKHADNPGVYTWGIDGEKGTLANMEDLGIWEPLSVKVQTLKTATNTAIMLLRIDDIVSGLKRDKAQDEPAQEQELPPELQE
eukprot:Clim_evm31s221 gene=Clim_evmTU31s221